MLPKNEFEEASQEKPVGFVREFLGVLVREQKVVAPADHRGLALRCSLLAIATAIAPYIYTLY